MWKALDLPAFPCKLLSPLCVEAFLDGDLVVHAEAVGQRLEVGPDLLPASRRRRTHQGLHILAHLGA